MIIFVENSRHVTPQAHTADTSMAMQSAHPSFCVSPSYHCVG
jgi:hypothetical protein